MVNFATKFDPAEPGSFDRAVDAGFRFAEFFLNAAILEQAEAVIAAARAHEMRYALHFPNRAELNEAHLDALVRLYTSLSCRATVIHPPMLERYGAPLLQRLPEIRLGVENGSLRSEAEFQRWAEENRWLTLDVEHLWKYTHPDVPLRDLVKAAARFLEFYGEKLVHVHLPGHLPGHPEHRPAYCNRDFVFAIWSLLDQSGFDGLVVSEVHPRFQNAHELRMDALLFEFWCKSGGG